MLILAKHRDLYKNGNSTVSKGGLLTTICAIVSIGSFIDLNSRNHWRIFLSEIRRLG